MEAKKEITTSFDDAAMIGKRLRAAREKEGMTRKELAEKSLVSLETLQRIENGDNIPSVDKVARICNCLHISADPILGTGIQRIQVIRDEIQDLPVFEVLVRQDVLDLFDAVDGLKLVDKRFVFEMAIDAAKKLKSYH